MGRLEEISAQRLEKLERARSKGIDPYPHRYRRSHTNQQALDLFLAREKSGEDTAPLEVTLAGRVMANRFMGKIAFMDLRDSSARIQLYFNRQKLGEERYQDLRDLDIGDIVGATGTLFRTRTGEITLDVSGFTLLAKSLHSLPEKWHGLVDVEKRFRHRYLDLISNEEALALFTNRSKFIASIRNFLSSRGFIEVETPVLQQLAGGALARPFITHHHALDEDLYLRIALELYLKRLIIGGFDKVFEIGRVFRNEGISTRHNPEFTMMECYQAYADYNDMMELVENMVYGMATEVLGSPTVALGDRTIDLTPPWPRIILRDTVIEHCGIDFLHYPDTQSLRHRMEENGMKVDPEKDRGRLIDELVSTFVEPHLISPVFLVDYPRDMSPLAKSKPGDEDTVERFEAFCGGIEIANAFTELNDPLEQKRRFQRQLEQRPDTDAEVEVIDDDFIFALEYGMPPTGGLGVGIDRLTMLLSGKQSIREIILFPQLKTKE